MWFVPHACNLNCNKITRSKSYILMSVRFSPCLLRQKAIRWSIANLTLIMDWFLYFLFQSKSPQTYWQCNKKAIKLYCVYKIHFMNIFQSDVALTGKLHSGVYISTQPCHQDNSRIYFLATCCPVIYSAAQTATCGDHFVWEHELQRGAF